MRTAILWLWLVGGLCGQEWVSLFDGKTLAGWRVAEFAGSGAARVENGMIALPAGGPMTGVVRTGAVPQGSYEVRWEAVRLQGNDLFASLTFPVGDSFATWVAGGWGGDVVGISSIDGWDAADNETRQYFTFENGRWYAFRLQVTPERIRGWIGDASVIDVSIAGRTLGLRPGPTKLTVPFGFFSYNTGGAVRKVEYRAIAGR